MFPDSLFTAHKAHRDDLLREAIMERLAAQLPARRSLPVRSAIARRLHAFANRLEQPVSPTFSAA